MTRVPKEVLDLLMMLDRARSAGDPWTSMPGQVFAPDVLEWAISRKLVNVETFEEGLKEYSITDEGRFAMVRVEVPDEPTTAEVSLRPVRLHSSMAYLLKKLADVRELDDGWLPSRTIELEKVPYHFRVQATQKGYVEARGVTAARELRITEKGVAVLGSAETKSVQPSVNIVPTPLDEADKAAIKTQIKESVDTLMHIPVFGGDGPVAYIVPDEPQDCASNCDTCLYRDIVDLLEKRVPGVSEIVSGLKTISRK